MKPLFLFISDIRVIKERKTPDFLNALDPKEFQAGGICVNQSPVLVIELNCNR